MFPLRGYPEMTTIRSISNPFEDGIVAYCAEEVRRQGDTPWHVYKMLEAWRIAQHLKALDYPITHGVIRELGSYVDEENENGYRKIMVTVGGRIAPTPIEIHARLSDLINRQNEISANQFYFEFELIHPFADGNGRTGKILFNYLLNQLDDPVWPVNFFGDIENP